MLGTADASIPLWLPDAEIQGCLSDHYLTFGFRRIAMILTNGKHSYSAGVSFVRTRRQTVRVTHAHSFDNGDVFVDGIFVILEKKDGKDIFEACN